MASPTPAQVDTDLSQLFATDPLKLTNDDFTRVVAAFREKRHKFVSGNKRAGTPVKKKSAAQKKAEEAVSILGQIELDL